MAIASTRKRRVKACSVVLWALPPAERKKLKRRASKAGDELHSDQESGEQMSDGVHHPAGGHHGGNMGGNNAMSTALVQYNQQHSQDFAAMLRGYPEISEVPSPAQVREHSCTARGAAAICYRCDVSACH